MFAGVDLDRWFMATGLPLGFGLSCALIAVPLRAFHWMWM
jgi:hypothetical protein